MLFTLKGFQTRDKAVFLNLHCRQKHKTALAIFMLHFQTYQTRKLKQKPPYHKPCKMYAPAMTGDNS